jgi:hypothetical protein
MSANTDGGTELLVRKSPRSESHLFNLSVRGFLTIIVFGTASYMAVKQIKIDEPYYSLVFLVAGFYFGQATKPKTQGSTA